MSAMRRVLLSVAVVMLASGCSSGGDRVTASGATGSSTTAAPVTITEPSVPAGTEDCGTIDELAGWPTTTTTPPTGYACIVDALAAGTPAQMTVVAAGRGDSGRTTQGGYDIPTKRISTWVVVGPGQVRETVDLTEDGGTSTTQVCTGLTVDAPRPQGTGCS